MSCDLGGGSEGQEGWPASHHSAFPEAEDVHFSPPGRDQGGGESSSIGRVTAGLGDSLPLSLPESPPHIHTSADLTL